MPHAHDYPQWLNLTNVTANNQTYTQSETQLNPPSQQHVLEVCKSEIRMPMHKDIGNGPGAVVGDAEFRVQTQITRTSQTAMLAVSDPDMISKREEEWQSFFSEVTETGGGGVSHTAIKIADYTVGGLGFLVAAQSLFMGVDTLAGTYGEQIEARILARWVKVDLSQLVEMVLQ